MPISIVAPPKESKYSVRSTVKQIMVTSVKEVVKGSDKKDFWHALVKKGTSEALKTGLVKIGVPDRVSEGLGDQFTVAYELVLAAGKGKLTAQKLNQLLIEKGLGLMKIADQGIRIQCGISAGYVALSASKAIGMLVAAEATGGVAGGALIAEVGDLMYKLYQMDNNCGISNSVKKQIESVSQTAASAMYGTIMTMLSRGGS